MPCFKFWGSCSLCPFCGYDCPSEHSEDDNKYYIYAQDREHSELNVVFKTKHKNTLIKKLKDIRDGIYHKNWGKKYKYTAILDTTRTYNGFYKAIQVNYIPYIDLVVTNGEANWHTDIHFILDIEKNQLYSTNECVTFEGKVPDLNKTWDGTLKFKNK